ncbi:MAG: hypothetical protein DRI39_04080 [Chloroflexi bacterium]|nr:MAG: hypothetical protein DRI39_04080 [Chloroflexota bacterium]
MEQLVNFRSRGQRIYGDFGLPYAGAPCVIMSHGLESSKDGDKWRLLASRLQRAGFATLRFSYRGCGEGPHRSEGAFEDTTLGGRIEDFKAAIAFLRGTEADTARLGVIGSSFGGMVALASGVTGIKAMVLVATPCRPLMAVDELWEKYGDEGLLELPSGRRLRVGMVRQVRECDIRLAVANVGCPLLVIHGSADETVPVSHAHELYHSAKEPKRLEIIESGNHGIDDPGHRERLVRLATGWFEQYL